MLDLFNVERVLRCIGVAFIALTLPFAIFMFYQLIYNLPMALEGLLGREWEIVIAFITIATLVAPGAAMLTLLPVGPKSRTLAIVVYVLYLPPILWMATPISDYCDLYYRCEGF